MLRVTQKGWDTEWDETLNFCCLAYNTMIHESTGFTPFELTFGHKANLPSSISKSSGRTCADEIKLRKKEWDSRLAQARDSLMKHKRRYKRDQERKIVKTQTVFRQGDSVLIRNDHKRDKLDDEWLGSYRIEEIKTPYYELLIDGQIKKIRGNRLKLYFPGRSPLQGTSRAD
jgi:hypothetical protein